MTCIRNLTSEILFEEPMARHTTFRVGGPAEAFARPKTTEELINIWNHCHGSDIPLIILGDGANVLVSDKGLRGVVVSTSKMNDIEILENNRIKALAGARLSKVAEVACKAGLAGFEFASGIPGTVGGAVYMNAGAYDHDIAEVCESVTLLHPRHSLPCHCKEDFSPTKRSTGSQRMGSTPDYTVNTLPSGEMNFGYRQSLAQQGNMLILDAIFQLHPGNAQEIREKMTDLNNRRRTSQPLDFPSAGSTFKRPPGHFAGKLIQDSGLKGFAIGGAQVSEKHAGFVINTGSATAQDIYDLIQTVREKVHENFGIWMEPEVKILGFG